MPKKEDVIAIIAARMDSKRFPGKMIHALCGDPLVGFVIERVKQVRGLKHIIVATTARSVDTPISRIAHKYGASVYRGDMDVDNVALRFLHCAKKYRAAYFVRINGDSPCIDTKLIEEGISYCGKGYDIVTNILHRTFPYGISVEITKTTTFESAYPLFFQNEREHITSYFYQNASKYSIKEVINTMSVGELNRFTIDTPQDLKKLNRFFKEDKNRPWYRPFSN